MYSFSTSMEPVTILLVAAVVSLLLTWIRTKRFDFRITRSRWTSDPAASRSSRRVPSPPPGSWRIPFLGSLWMPGRNYFRVLSDLRDRYGDVFRMTVGVRDVVVLNGCHAVTAALANGSPTARSLAGRPDLHAFRLASLGQTMSFNGYSPEWKAHRQLTERALAGAVSATDFVQTTVVREAKVLANVLIEKSTSSAAVAPENDEVPRWVSIDPKNDEVPRWVSIDPEGVIKRSIGHVMFSLCFGDSRTSCHRRINGEGNGLEQTGESIDTKQLSIDEDDDDDVDTILRSSECIVRGSQNAASIVDFFPWARHLVRSKLASLDRMCATMLATTRRLTDEHRSTRRAGVVRDVVDALVEAADETAAGRRLGAQRVEMTVQEFVGAGYDILAAAASWIVVYMAEYPEIQDRVRKEADAASSADGGSSEAAWSTTGRRCAGQPTGSTSPVGMTFAEAVVLEVLRHACVVPLALPHAAIEDTKINGYDVRSGTFVLVNLHSACRDKIFWSDSESFLPDRFLPKTTTTTTTTTTTSFDHELPVQPKAVPDSAAEWDADATVGKLGSSLGCDRPPTFSFGVGKRRCVGEKLSCRVLVAYLTTLVRESYIERPRGVAHIDLTPSDSSIILLKPKPFKICVRRRDVN